MVWNSIAAMAAVDILIVALVVIAAVWLRRHRHPYEDAKLHRAARLISAGLAVVLSICLLDLFIMLVLPSLIPEARATAFMSDLRLELNWLVMAAFISVLVFGFVTLYGNQKRLLEVIDGSRAKLDESERYFRTLAQGSIQGIIVHDNGRPLFANQAMADTLGYESPEDLMRLASIDEYIHPDDLARTRGLRHARLAGADGVPNMVEYRCLLQNGRTIHLQALAMEIEWGGSKAIQAACFDITERRQTEQALRDSEARLAEAQHIAHIGSWQRDFASDTLYWSDEIFRIFGFAPQQITASYAAFETLIHPDDLRTLESALASMRSGEAPLSIDYRLVRPDGEVRTVHEQGRAFFADDGSLLRTAGTIQDITERKHVEVALMESEAAFRGLLENANRGVFIHRAGHTLFANQAIADLYGYASPQAVLANPTMDEHIAPEERPRLLEYRRLREAGQQTVNTYEFRALRKDGSSFWLENENQTISWHGERAILTMVSDVSDRHEAQAALHTSRENLAAAQRIAHIGSWERNFTTNSVEWSDEAYRIFGYEPQQVDAGYAEFEKRVHPDDLPAVEAAVAAAMAGEAPYSIEHRIVHPDGMVRTVYERGEVIFAEDGTPQQFIGTMQDITEQVHVEEALRESERRLESVAENMPGGMFQRVLHPDGRIEYPYLSARAHGLAGVYPDDVDRMVRAIHKSAETMTVFDEEQREIAEDGSITWWHAIATPRAGTDGDVIWDGVRVEITELKHREEELRRSEQRFRNLVEGSIQGLLVHVDQTPKFANQAFVDILGYDSLEDVLRIEAVDDLIHPDDAGRILAIRAARERGEAVPKVMEFRALRKDGSWVWVEVRPTIIDWNGKPAMHTALIDITERREAEEALKKLNVELEQRVVARTRELRREKDKAESYLDIANTMFLALDRQGSVTLVNRKLCEVLGYAEEELVGQNWHAMCVPEAEADERKRRYLDRIAHHSDAFVANQGAEFRMVTKGGEMRTVSWSDSPIRDDHGSLVGILGAAEDITNQRQIEIELRQAQRSEALANLAGGISHSLNNLLTPIIALGDMLQQRLPADSRDQAFAAQIVESGRHASDLVQRILAFSRRDESKPIISNIAALVEDTVELLRPTVATTITIDLDVDAAAGEVFADPVQIETVLMNLITNAAAAIGDKTGNIEVTLNRRHLETESGELQAGDYARLIVADDGPGIPSDVLENIFDPFFTTKEVGEGTGLGLSIADGVVKRHGGILRVQSEPGAGARFEVYLPLHDALETA